MRALLLGLVLAAATKVWVYDSAYRSATEKALLAAYRDHAIAACQKEAPQSADKVPLGLAIDWSRQATAGITIGNRAVDVYFWEIESDLWDDRFRKAFLVLHAPAASLSCAYDLDGHKASITRT